MINDNQSPKYVFLTRGEIHIHDQRILTVHLKPKDPRIKEISKGVGKDLCFITVNPKNVSKFTLFYPNSWYLIPKVEYTGSVDYLGYVHFSFVYKFSKSYNFEKGDPVKMLSYKDIENFKKNLSL